MKFTDFKKVHIDNYLKIVFRLINEGKRTLAITKDHKIRNKNKKFMRKFKLKEKDIDELIKDLVTKDFCYAIDEENPNFSNDRLYVFCEQKELDYFGIPEIVDIYIKLKKHTLKDNNEIILYMSFHEKEREIKYLFRDKS